MQHHETYQRRPLNGAEGNGNLNDRKSVDVIVAAEALSTLDEGFLSTLYIYTTLYIYIYINILSHQEVRTAAFCYHISTSDISFLLLYALSGPSP